MEGLVIIILAIFLLTSAGQRDTRQPKEPIAAPPGSEQAQNAFKYHDTGGTTTPQGPQATGDYENTDSLRIKDLIKRFKPDYPDVQVEMYASIIIKYGRTYNIDPKLLAGLICRESAFDPKARSSTGALGLGQIKPFNFAALGITDPYNPEQNVKGIAIMLRDFFEKWRGQEKRLELSLASYKEGYNAIAANKKYKPDTEKYIEDIKGFIRNMH